MRHSEVTLDDKYLLEDGRAFITGVQALISVLLDESVSTPAPGSIRRLPFRLSRLAPGRPGPAGRAPLQAAHRP
jgi:hypothetical protein